MTTSANKHRRNVEYAVGDLVYLKFRPYRQHTLFKSRNRKLSPRFYGPFLVEARIVAAAYRLKLPNDTRIHPVFHVSLLKKVIGGAVVEAKLSEVTVDLPFLPEKILDQRTIVCDGEDVKQVLIQWVGRVLEEANWMDVADVMGQLIRTQDGKCISDESEM